MPILAEPAYWALAIFAALCVGLAKTGFGGLGLLAVVVFAELMPAKESTGALLPLLIFGDILGVLIYRRHANWSDLAKLLPATMVGIISGWWLMPRIPDGVFAPLLGWLILGAAGLFAILQLQFPQLLLTASRHPALGLLAGWSAGVATLLANAAGGITSFYFLARRLDKMAFVGTAAWFFFIVNLCKVPFSLQLGLINPGSLRLDLILLPAVLAGGLAGRLLIGRISQKMFERVTILLAGATALRLIFK
jgi:uncharacterized membrane protein YfcA